MRSSFHDLSGCARKTFELTNWPKRHAWWLLLLRFSNFFFPTLEPSSRDLLPALDSNLYGRIDSCHLRYWNQALIKVIKVGQNCKKVGCALGVWKSIRGIKIKKGPLCSLTSPEASWASMTSCDMLQD